MIDYLKKSLITYLNQILRLALVAGSNIIIARYLGPSGKGVLTLLMNFLAIVVMIGMVGIDEANVYYISSKKATHKRIFSNALFQTFVVSVLCIFIFLGLKTWFLSNPLKGIPLQYFHLMLFIIPLYFFNQHAKTILLGHRAIYAYNVFVILQFLMLFLFQLILIPFYDLYGGVLSIIISVVILSLLGIVLLYKYGPPDRVIDFSLLRKSYSFGARSQLGLVFSYLNRRLDVFIVNYFLDPYQVGIYAIAVAVGELPWHLPSAAATVLFPWIADKKKQDAASFTSYVLRNVFLLTFILVLVLALLGRFVITLLFGAAFQDSVILMYILLPGILALGITRVLGGHFQGSGRPELGTLMVAFSFAETIILDIILIPRMGVLGAAIASSIAYITSAVVGLFIFTRLWKVRVVDAVIPRWEEVAKLHNFFKLLKKGD
ncbi:hypothetical protein AMJ44_05835 [candidate division WOR-1 bacterium DG_54_3]|uniref:Uncharacterized protein n=1 Tax=candidate division WOR-1 bacterium DG_54_3 TaxID=1703775 RepID=A0A0S7Y1L5_UNCSA|nr:MAG: hypothetical protein AMJ44_05835 [candidate division WOR-1 bacterium DG_54_3]